MENRTDADFWDKVRPTLELAQKMKAAMKAKGKTTAWTKCPRCGGKVRAVLAGHKQHIHMACETAGCIRMME
jgi:ribosomal protein S27AE